MKCFTCTPLTRRFTPAILMMGMLTLPALGQSGDKTKSAAGAKPGKAEIVKPHVQTAFDHTLVDVAKKAARPFKAIELVDPKTGKKVGGDHMIDAPGGKKVSAKVYFAALNDFEKKLSQMGHSLHDKTDKVVLSRNRVNHAELQKKAKAIHATHAPFNAKTMKAVVKRSDLHSQFKTHAEKDAARVDALKKHLGDASVRPRGPAAAGSGSNGTVKQWSHELGNRKIIAAALAARLETKGGTESVSVLGSVEADAYLANKQLQLLRASASASVDKAGAGKGSVTVSIAGRTVYNKDLSVQSGLTKTDELSKTFDQGVSFRFSLGPIPMSVKMGARGSIGIRYFVGVRPLSLQAQFVPFAKVDAYAQCAVDVFIAAVGVRANLKVIDFEMRIGGGLVVKVDPSTGASLEEHAYVFNNLQMLKGELALYADVGVWIFKKHIEHDFWKFNGFKTTGYLVNVNRTIKLPG